MLRREGEIFFFGTAILRSKIIGTKKRVQDRGEMVENQVFCEPLLSVLATP